MALEHLVHTFSMAACSAPVEIATVIAVVTLRLHLVVGSYSGVVVGKAVVVLLLAMSLTDQTVSLGCLPCLPKWQQQGCAQRVQPWLSLESYG